MQLLKRTQFGNPLLRQIAQPLTKQQIISVETKMLIQDMRHTLISKKLGIGLAAPQVGHSLAIAVISIRPLPHRPEIEPFDLVIINPVIEQGIGRQQSMWEGCISAGICARVPRYTKLKLKYYDDKGKLHHKEYKGLQAQVIQHEVDHLNGILFVDRVKDPKSYMTFTEYKKRIAKKKPPKTRS